MLMPATVRSLFGVPRRVPREVVMTAAQHSLLTVLMRIPLTWAFRTAGSAMMGAALADAMCEAMPRALG
jgi:anti-sigma factor RsiW